MKINVAIGQYLRQFRQENNLTLEQIATASQRYGSGWTSGTISSMESGGSSVASLPNLLILLPTLTDLADGERISLESIFGKAGELELANKGKSHAFIEGSQILEVLSGKKVQPVMSREVELSSEDVAFGKKMSRLFGSNNIDYINHISKHVITPSEKRMAKKLSIHPFSVAVSCVAMYGHYLDDEIAERTGKNASPQKRGRVSRVIAEEVRERVAHLTESE